eukprot:351125-Chlamydomonas_euryale.AAC.4
MQLPCRMTCSCETAVSHDVFSRVSCSVADEAGDAGVAEVAGVPGERSSRACMDRGWHRIKQTAPEAAALLCQGDGP